MSRNDHAGSYFITFIHLLGSMSEVCYNLNVTECNNAPEGPFIWPFTPSCDPNTVMEPESSTRHRFPFSFTFLWHSNALQKCKAIHGGKIYQLHFRPLTVTLTLRVGTSVLCMTHTHDACDGLIIFWITAETSDPWLWLCPWVLEYKYCMRLTF